MIIAKDKSCYIFEQERLNSFAKWIYDDDKSCNKSAMAAAGFFKCNPNDSTNDDCACFYCGKTLDGWDADDDPSKEHKAHSPSCKFINLGRREGQLKVGEFLDLMESWFMNYLDKVMEHEREPRIALFNRIVHDIETRFRG